MRHTPTLEFILDALPESAAHIDDLLAKARQSDAEVAAAAASASFAGEADPYRHPAADDDDDDEDDDRSARLERPAPEGLLVVDKPAGSGPRTTWSRASAGSPGRARSATPAPSTRWPPASCCSASGARPGCSATSRWPTRATTPRSGSARRPRPTTPRVRSARAPTRRAHPRRGRPARRSRCAGHPAGAVEGLGDQDRRTTGVQAGPFGCGRRDPGTAGHVDRLEIAEVRVVGAFLDVDVHVDCSTGTTSVRWRATWGRHSGSVAT